MAHGKFGRLHFRRRPGSALSESWVDTTHRWLRCVTFFRLLVHFLQSLRQSQGVGVRFECFAIPATAFFRTSFRTFSTALPHTARARGWVFVAVGRNGQQRQYRFLSTMPFLSIVLLHQQLLIKLIHVLASIRKRTPVLQRATSLSDHATEQAKNIP